VTSKIETLAHELTVARQGVAKFTEAKRIAEQQALEATERADQHAERLALLAARIDRLNRQISGEIA
jgi:hypothetical protein